MKLEESFELPNFYNQLVNLHSRANRAINADISRDQKKKNEDISLNLDNF